MLMAKFSSAFTKWAGLLKKASDLKGKADEISGQTDGLLKLSKAKDDKERAKIAKEILGIDSLFTKYLDAVTKVRENLTAIRDADPEWPDDADCADLFVVGAQANDKYGKGSKEAKKAWAAYAKALSLFADEISEVVIALKGMQKQVPGRKKAAAALVKVASMISSALEAAQKVPLPSTILAAVFMASQDADLLYGQAMNVAALLDDISKKVDQSVTDGDFMDGRNARWLAWASRAADMDVQEINKNARAQTPR